MALELTTESAIEPYIETNLFAYNTVLGHKDALAVTGLAQARRRRGDYKT